MDQEGQEDLVVQLVVLLREEVGLHSCRAQVEELPCLLEVDHPYHLEVGRPFHQVVDRPCLLAEVADHPFRLEVVLPYLQGVVADHPYLLVVEEGLPCPCHLGVEEDHPCLQEVVSSLLHHNPAGLVGPADLAEVEGHRAQEGAFLLEHRLALVRLVGQGHAALPVAPHSQR